MMETVISAIADEFLVLRKYKIRLTLGICILLFLLGLPMCANVSYLQIIIGLDKDDLRNAFKPAATERIQAKYPIQELPPSRFVNVDQYF